MAGIKEAIEAAGARYLPAYSPDLNPIEQLFARLRKAAARTFDALIAAIAHALAKVTPIECTNYIVNSGYRHQS